MLKNRKHIIEQNPSFGYSLTMNKLIIFDLDGTLADTREDLAAALNLTRGSFGLPELALEEVVSYIGGGRASMIEKSFHDASGHDLILAGTRFTKYYNQNLTVKTRLYDGVSDTIKRLHEMGCHQAVLSNKPGDMSRDILAYFGLSRYLVTAMGGGDSAELKPAPGGVLEVIKRAEAKGFRRENDNVWMVGDHHTDLQVAMNAGLKSIFCTYGFGDRRGLGADFDISEFSDIIEIIQD